jgi:hypothetical protein
MWSSREVPALHVSQPGHEPRAQCLQGSTEFRFAGQQDRQAQSKDRENHPDGSHGAPFEREWVRGGERENSVAAGQFSEVYGEPRVGREVKEFDLTKHGSRNSGGRKPPRVRVAAEFEAGQKQADAGLWRSAADEWELRKDVRSTRAGDCDPDQTALCSCRLDLASHAGDWDLRGSRLPLVLGAEPRDRLFVRLDLGGRGPDAAGVDDVFEFQARGVVEDVVGWVGAGGKLVSVGDGNELDVDFHVLCGLVAV